MVRLSERKVLTNEMGAGARINKTLNVDSEHRNPYRLVVVQRHEAQLVNI